MFESSGVRHAFLAQRQSVNTVDVEGYGFESRGTRNATNARRNLQPSIICIKQS